MTDRLSPLPLGSITAGGFFNEQLERSKCGMGGKLPALEPSMIATPFTTKECFGGWGGNSMGWGGEISGNYWRGFVELAFTLGDAQLIKVAEKWVDAVLKTQRDDGYLGTYTDESKMHEDYNAWGTHCGMAALLEYYDATRRGDVLEAVHRCLLWFCVNWSGEKKTPYAGGTICISMAQVYSLTGDERLARFIAEYMDYTEHNDLFARSITALLRKEIPFCSDHGAGWPLAVKVALSAYRASGDEKCRAAAVNTLRRSIDGLLQKSGGVPVMAEYIIPDGYAAESEYCAFTELSDALSLAARETGAALYGDIIERVVFNAAQGARKKDEKAIAYLSSPNQIFATMNSSRHPGYFQAYSPCHGVACCAVNSVRIIPEYVKNMAFTDCEGSLYFYLYGACDIKSDGLCARVVTDYPFEDKITVYINGDSSEKALYFRVPAYCTSPILELDGKSVAVSVKDGYICIKQKWANQKLVLSLPAELKISRVDDSMGGKYFPLTVEYGALLFSLPLEAEWKAIKGAQNTPLPEGWSWFEARAKYPSDGEKDSYVEIATRRTRMPWCVALVEGGCEARLEPTGAKGYVWENPRLKVKIKAYKAPTAYPPYPENTPDVYSPVPVTSPCELTLVPYGCTNLRITYFPRGKRVE